MEAVRKMGAKVNWKESSFTDSKGNGSVMRSGVVGTMYWNDPEYAFRIGCLTSVPTHNNLEAILGSGVAAFLVAAAIKAERTFNEVITDVLFLCSDFMNPYVVPMYPHKVKLGTTYQEQNPWYAISRIAAAYVMGIGQVPPEEMIKRIGNHVTLGMGHVLWDGAVIPALAEAIFFNARYNSFNKIVLETVNNTDDCDTVGAIAGTIAGARVGVLGIQKDWRQRIEMSDYLHNIANRLWDASLNVVVTKIEPEKSMEDTVDVDALLEGDDDITF
jgi:ADP-ribosylglycohydrolase